VIRSIRNLPPTHFVFRIQSFSLLAQNAIEKYDSAVLESGGYKWYYIILQRSGFCSSVRGYGWETFMDLSSLYDPAKGYLVNDTSYTHS
ncbi:hypothetical protein GIB67_024544, partial [Kingdonia uniflora]